MRLRSSWKEVSGSYWNKRKILKGYWYRRLISGKISSQARNDARNKNVKNLHSSRGKASVLHALLERLAFVQFTAVVILTTTWNDQFCSCVDDANIWRQMKLFFISKPLKPVEFLDTYFASQTREMITYVPSYIFRCCLCLISIFWACTCSTAKFPYQSESAVQSLLFILASMRPFAMPKRGNMFDHAVWFWMQVQDWFRRRTLWDP